MSADVRVVIRRHFPVAGPRGTRVVQKVAGDIALRRRPSRGLRGPDRVKRALAEDVLPRVTHLFDRGAVVAASGEICARVAAACASWFWWTHSRAPVLFRPGPPYKLMRSGVAVVKDAVARAGDPDAGSEPGSGLPAAAAKEQPRHIGVIGGSRPDPVEKRFQGWLPW